MTKTLRAAREVFLSRRQSAGRAPGGRAPFPQKNHWKRADRTALRAHLGSARMPIDSLRSAHSFAWAFKSHARATEVGAQRLINDALRCRCYAESNRRRREQPAKGPAQRGSTASASRRREATRSRYAPTQKFKEPRPGAFRADLLRDQNMPRCARRVLVTLQVRPPRASPRRRALPSRRRRCRSSPFRPRSDDQTATRRRAPCGSCPG